LNITVSAFFSQNNRS